MIFICFDLFWFDSNLRRIRFIELSSGLGTPILDRFQKNLVFVFFSIRSFKFLGRRMVSFRWRTVYWMMNVRGNQYSRKHIKYDTCSSCEEFCDFGIEEPGLYDYPASAIISFGVIEKQKWMFKVRRITRGKTILEWIGCTRCFTEKHPVL